MANWYGSSRTNYFQVKDPDAFKAEMAKHEVDVWQSTTRGTDWFGLGAQTEDGSWPSVLDADDDPVAEFWEVVAPHLADGQVAVLQTIGAEKLRYLTGYAIAVTNAAAPVFVSIDDVYMQAYAKFGVPMGSIADATY